MSMLERENNFKRCKKCNHLGKFHKLVGIGFPTKYFYVYSLCVPKYTPSWRRNEESRCKEKQFEGE